MLKKYSSQIGNRSNEVGRVDSFLAGLIAITFLILGTVVYFGLKMGTPTKVETDSRVELSVDSDKYDWGTVDYNGGIVSKSFLIKNSSETVLKLYDVKTSCMCTTAQLTTSDKSSKKFGMHELSLDVFEVKPQDSAELVVEFDPAYHGPSGIGPISRTVTLKTNAAKNPELSFYLTANVVKK